MTLDRNADYFKNADGTYQPYGMMLSLDMFQCDASRFNRNSIESFFNQLCTLTAMEPCELHFWDDLETPEEEKQTLPHTVGTSAVQFILTSNMVIHTLDRLESVYIDCFTCKPFDPNKALEFCKDWFHSGSGRAVYMERFSEGLLRQRREADSLARDLKTWDW